MYQDIESAPRAELERIQRDRLRETVRHVYDSVDFYRDRLDDAGVSPADIETISDITTLPFTGKEHFESQYPDGLFAGSDEDLTRIQASSGTTGKQKLVAYTDDDLRVWREVMARSLAAAGIEPADTFQNAYGYGLFTGGLGFHDGVEELGATVVPTGGGNTALQLELLRDLDVDALGCTPSYCLYLAEAADERDIDVRGLPLSTVVIGAEPFTDPMRAEIEDALDVTAVDMYGLSELIGPGVAVECAEAQDGLHLWEDHFYPEIVDPETGEPLPEGERGELVLTSLTKEALPVLRYRTGDVTSLTYEACECGRTSARIENIRGRVDDLLIVRGVNVYASSIEEVLVEIDDVAPHYRIDLYRDGSLDTMELTVERHADADRSREALHDLIERRLTEILNVTVDDLSVVPSGEIDRQETGKVRRVFDHR
ncbi:phenylacetate--CoA ligase PaaK [Halovivax limisalsi]|uniref:phenylacetate--CoA ligase PaaK n=1 Tax=Halovivax limisalsi TaxID=1453760 RepID=UPI001FFDCFD0|nr:phenylacetate--CoA ligase PaaK [Halovivax limisalsi]